MSFASVITPFKMKYIQTSAGTLLTYHNFTLNRTSDEIHKGKLEVFNSNMITNVRLW